MFTGRRRVTRKWNSPSLSAPILFRATVRHELTPEVLHFLVRDWGTFSLAFRTPVSWPSHDLCRCDRVSHNRCRLREIGFNLASFNCSFSILRCSCNLRRLVVLVRTL